MVIIGEGEDCSDTGGLSAAPSMYGDALLVIEWSTTDAAKYNVEINFAWTNKGSSEPCPESEGVLEGDQ